MKTRLDCEAVKRGLFTSRAKAQAAIMAGKVTVNGLPAYKAGHCVKDSDKLEILASACPYVSRGGLKLKAAIDVFKINVMGLQCADIGAATGGFTDCLLQEGASKVYAVDVGKGQLDDKIKKKPEVVFIPGTNARFLTPGLFSPPPSLAVIDVSFISLKLVLLPVINSLAENADIVALIKPQFELSPKQTPKGIVKTEENRMEAVNSLRQFITSLNLPGYAVKELGLIESPIKGAKGNIEYLWRLRKTASG